MNVVEPGPVGVSLLPRVSGILFLPKRTWDEIADEPTPGSWLIKHYVAPLAAIPAICGLIGMALFGYSIAGIGFQANLATSLIEATVDFALTLGAVWLVAGLIAVLAPLFGGVRSLTRALKLAAYSGTAFWVAGAVSLYPSFGILAGVLAGLYSLYTLRLGLPKLMRSPPERALSYFAAVLLAVVVVFAFKGLLVSRASDLGGPLRIAPITVAPR